MFGRLKFARKLWNANNAASRIVMLISPSLFPAAVPSGGFDPGLRSDAFVMGYIYGVILACEDDERDRIEKGLLVQQVFEQLFPLHGRALTEYCASQALVEESRFQSCH